MKKIDHRKAPWLQMLEWPIKVVSEFRPNAPQPQFTSQDQYRIAKALCVLNAGAESCDPQKNPYANSLAALFKDIVPTSHTNSEAANQAAIAFAWGGNDYQLLCGAGVCTLQKQVVVERSEWEQFLTSGIISSCTPSPQETKFEDVGSFKDGDAVILPQQDSSKIVDTPVSVQSKHKAIQLSVGRTGSCAVLDDGDIWCWGSYETNKPFIDGPTATFPKRIANIPGWVAPGINGEYATCGLLNSAVTCLGNGKWNSDDDNQILTAAKTVSNIKALFFGIGKSCAITASNDLHCWSADKSGYGVFAKIPTKIPGLNGEPVSVALGGDSACALLSNGKVMCWGLNDNKQLGNDQGVASLSPVEVKGIYAVSSISAGLHHYCASMSLGGDVYCWGEDTNLYNPPPPAHEPGYPGYLPRKIEGLETVTKVVSNYQYNCTITSGKVFCWGNVKYAGPNNVTNKPMQVSGLVDVVDVGIGANGAFPTQMNAHACALTKGGNVYCWGDNSLGQLGLPPPSDSSTIDQKWNPVKINF